MDQMTFAVPLVGIIAMFALLGVCAVAAIVVAVLVGRRHEERDQ